LGGVGGGGGGWGEGMLRQTSPPREVVVATDEPGDASWVGALGGCGARVVLRPGDARWPQVVAAAQQQVLAVWRGGCELAVTDLADVELFAVTPGRAAVPRPEGVVAVDRGALAGCGGPVAGGAPREVCV